MVVGRFAASKPLVFLALRMPLLKEMHPVITVKVEAPLVGCPK